MTCRSADVAQRSSTTNIVHSPGCQNRVSFVLSFSTRAVQRASFALALALPLYVTSRAGKVTAFALCSIALPFVSEEGLCSGGHGAYQCVRVTFL
jgi:hypothetical protein